MGAGTSPAQPEFFLCGNPDDLSATSQRPIFTKFGHETYFGVPSRNPERHFWKIFTLGVICPQNLKSQVGLTGTSLRAGYRSRDALYCLFHVVVQGTRSFRRRVNFFVRRTVAEQRGVKVAQFSDFGLFPHTKSLKSTFR